MDNNQGVFESISHEKFMEQIKKVNPQVFEVGEIIEIRGSRLRVDKIYKNKITFKLLPKLDK